MRPLLGLLTALLAAALIFSFAWKHRSAVPISSAPLPPASSQAVDTHTEYAEETQARELVTIAGPLADYMSRHSANQPVEIGQHPRRITVASDLAGDSPIGSSQPILHTTFPLGSTTNLSFEIPAHASNPQLHGTYSSFLRQDGTNSSDDADVDFLLLDEQQFSDFIHQRPGDVLFSATGAHDQEINFTLPPTFDKAVKYYLIFRNGSNAQKRVVVQADFRLDF